MQSKALERSVNTAPTKKKNYLNFPSTLLSFLWAHVEYCAIFCMLLKRWMKHFYFRDQKVFWKLLIYFWQSVQNTDWSEIWNRMFIFCNDSKFQYPHRSYKLDDVVSWKVSWKLCLNLCSRRWLKPGLNLVSNCIRFRLL